MPEWVAWLPHVNASLNLLATILLVVGYRLIKQKREIAHRNVMLACFGVSTIFLASYLVHKANVQALHFDLSYGNVVRYGYLALLLSHSLLAAAVPFLAIATIITGLRDNRSWHRKLAKWTFPIWLYVSITGVLVYLMLYHFFPPRPTTAKMMRSERTMVTRRVSEGVLKTNVDCCT